jgi:mersacidin/lichenicidin family type 2 lantibiotic
MRQIERRSQMEGMFNTPAETQVPLTTLDIVRSWKDPRYRRTLSVQQLQTLPNHPAGPALLTDQELKVAGGLMLEEEDISIPLTTALGCTEWTFHNWKSCGC